MAMILPERPRRPGFLESLLGSATQQMARSSEAAAKEKALEKEYALKGQLEERKQASKFAEKLKMAKDLGVDKMFADEITTEKPKRQEVSPHEKFPGIGKVEEPSETKKPAKSDKISNLKNKLIPENKIAKMSLVDPAVANQMRQSNKEINKQIRHEEGISEKKANILMEETAPLKKAIIERANLSRESIRHKTHLLDLIDRGNLDDPTFAAFATMLPFNLGKRLLSEDTVEYKGGLVDEFGDLKNIFKGATRVKEVELYEDKLADIYLTDAQKKAILKSRINTAKIDILREEAAAEVEENYPPMSALQFNKKVEEILKPKLDAVFNTIWDEQKSILDQAEARKKIPLNFDDPEDNQIIEQILIEAGKDYKKAEKLAKQKGYTWQ